MVINNIQFLALALGVGANCLLIAGLIWSIYHPETRVWPPQSSTTEHKTAVWLLTVVGFGSTLAFGFVEWNFLEPMSWLRWGIGVSLIVIGNLVVWSGVFHLGFEATSGGETGLKTRGLYRFSRNPQYVADMSILIGIGLLSASLLVWPVVLTGVAALALAPFAEEPWLFERYGDAYQKYRSSTRRFI